MAKRTTIEHRTTDGKSTTYEEDEDGRTTTEDDKPAKVPERVRAAVEKARRGQNIETR